MKYLAALPLAAVLALGTVSTANAWSLPQAALEGTPYAETYPDAYVWDHCHGQSSGSAAASCGTKTGGPSGGLF